jgi:formylmethanofuran dehydrogenase subunit E
LRYAKVKDKTGGGMMDERAKLWREAIKFHGHSCPGLAIGVRVALDCREEMNLASRAEDEEIVAVAETDACGVDGIQVILACTAGKANLWLRRRGKHVFSI